MVALVFNALLFDRSVPARDAPTGWPTHHVVVQDYRPNALGAATPQPDPAPGTPKRRAPRHAQPYDAVPGESEEERRKRHNREAVARWRDRRRVVSVPEHGMHDPVVARADKAYRAAVAGHAQALHVVKQWAEYLDATKAALLAAKDDFDARVAAAGAALAYS